MKKLKQVSSLVQKWQTVKAQVEEEENMDDIEDEEGDYEQTSEKRIQEWKKEMENRYGCDEKYPTRAVAILLSLFHF